MEMTYPIMVETTSGSVLHVVSDRTTIEAYGSVNELVHRMIKPLNAVTRIEVSLYSEELEDLVTEVTFDKALEAWKNSGERVVIEYDFYGIGMTDEERGYIGFKEGWLPCYTLRKFPNAKKAYSLMTDSIIDIKSAKLVNAEANNQRKMDAYYKDPAKANEKRLEYYYANHEENKKKEAERARAFRANQKRYGLA